MTINDFILIAIASFGALCQELAHWYDLRHKLEHRQYEKLLHSWKYWLITFIMIAISGIGTWLLYGDKLNLKDVFFIMGAAFPIIFKKLVVTIGNEVRLGGKQESTLMYYFR